MGTFAETAVVVYYRLSFAEQGQKRKFAVSVFRLQ
jgi:hypothetical protein